jgi:anti-sigma factor RsiW
MATDDLPCNELVELVTDYLEQRLDDDDRERFEEHLRLCEGCANYLEQMRTTIAVAGSIPEQEIAPEALAELVAAFRGWRARSPG